jgi:hypothetical protein
MDVLVVALLLVPTTHGGPDRFNDYDFATAKLRHRKPFLYCWLKCPVARINCFHDT